MGTLNDPLAGTSQDILNLKLYIEFFSSLVSSRSCSAAFLCLSFHSLVSSRSCSQQSILKSYILLPLLEDLSFCKLLDLPFLKLFKSYNCVTNVSGRNTIETFNANGDIASKSSLWIFHFPRPVILSLQRIQSYPAANLCPWNPMHLTCCNIKLILLLSWSGSMVFLQLSLTPSDQISWNQILEGIWMSLDVEIALILRINIFMYLYILLYTRSDN